MLPIYIHSVVAAHVILNIKDICHHSKDRFISLKWMPIHDRIKFRKATMVYKNVNDLVPNYVKDMFTYMRDSHSYNKVIC